MLHQTGTRWSCPMIPCLLLACLCSGCADEKSESTTDEEVGLWAWETLAACADGSLYMTDGTGGVFWVVKGCASKVDLSIEEDPFLLHATTDAFGGVYLFDKRKLWYLKDGSAREVKTIDVDAAARKHRLSPNSTTVLWASMQDYSEDAYGVGLDAGFDQGLDAGREESP